MRELFCYSTQVAAVEIIGRVGFFKFTRLPSYRLVDALVELRCLTELFVVFNAAFCAAVVGEAEADGEKLRQKTKRKPMRGLEATLKNREPEALGCSIAYTGKMSVISGT